MAASKSSVPFSGDHRPRKTRPPVRLFRGMTSSRSHSAEIGFGMTARPSGVKLIVELVAQPRAEEAIAICKPPEPEDNSADPTREIIEKIGSVCAKLEADFAFP